MQEIAPDDSWQVKYQIDKEIAFFFNFSKGFAIKLCNCHGLSLLFEADAWVNHGVEHITQQRGDHHQDSLDE